MGRILGIDHGEKSIGLALSDPMRIFATPFAVIRGEKALFAELPELIEDREIDSIVLGLPFNMDGSIGPQAQRVLAFKARMEKHLGSEGQRLGKALQVPIETVDERLSSVEADLKLQEGGVRRKDRGALIDKVAAQILLQGYLDQTGS